MRVRAQVLAYFLARSGASNAISALAVVRVPAAVATSYIIAAAFQTAFLRRFAFLLLSRRSPAAAGCFAALHADVKHVRILKQKSILAYCNWIQQEICDYFWVAERILCHDVAHYYHGIP